MTSLESETGMDPGWINNGGLFIANNKVGERNHLKPLFPGFEGHMILSGHILQ